MRIRVLRDADISEGLRKTTALKAGQTYVVRRAVGEEAIAIGAAELVEPDSTEETGRQETVGARRRRS